MQDLHSARWRSITAAAGGARRPSARAARSSTGGWVIPVIGLTCRGSAHAHPAHSVRRTSGAIADPSPQISYDSIQQRISAAGARQAQLVGDLSSRPAALEAKRQDPPFVLGQCGDHAAQPLHHGLRFAFHQMIVGTVSPLVQLELVAYVVQVRDQPSGCGPDRLRVQIVGQTSQPAVADLGFDAAERSEKSRLVPPRRLRVQPAQDISETPSVDVVETEDLTIVLYQPPERLG